MNAVRSSRERFLRRVAQLSVGQLLSATIGLLLVLAVVGIGLALIANVRLNNNRHLLLEEVGPALRATLELENALVNEETGVRGYIITAQPRFLDPYHSGLVDEARAYAALGARERAVGVAISAQVGAVRARAREWRRRFVVPALSRSARTRLHGLQTALAGKTGFDAVRSALQHLQSALQRKDLHTRALLNSTAHTLLALLVLAAVLVLGGVLGAGLLLRRTITAPLARLGTQARRIAGGSFEEPLALAAGPREVAEVGAELDAMRRRIVDELAAVKAAHEQLAQQAVELRRSNAELEQFAYVASHDLQEPLRKVASFCQALQSRYHGQLDERADQYIEFAVDGAKRMQTLINDLLAFSRVGRGGREHEPVDLNEVLAAAREALAGALDSAAAEVLAEPLPTVRGDRTLLVSLFQNLIANAVKFRSPAPPLVRISVQREQERWLLRFADNGIGIEPEYAERIFLIFQRLHSREAYDGSGIGLALARKIIEYHGGGIWLDPDYVGGACFCMTLPIAKETRL